MPPKICTDQRPGKSLELKKVSARGHQLFHPLLIAVDCHSQPQTEDFSSLMRFSPRDLKSGANLEVLKLGDI